MQWTCPSSPENSLKKEWMGELHSPCHPDTVPAPGTITHICPPCVSPPPAPHALPLRPLGSYTPSFQIQLLGPSLMDLGPADTSPLPPTPGHLNDLKTPSGLYSFALLM